MPDPHDLNRFIRAQEDVYEWALREVTDGHKRTHWMWFIFPQLDGLARSPTSRRFAIRSLAEARAFIEHPVLGPRLSAIAEAVVGLEGRSAREVFGSPDDLKLRSSVTLFASVSPPGSVFARLLAKYFGGVGDEKTLQILSSLTETA
jgi:uncharacterized protein (DUF1810 family)